MNVIKTAKHAAPTGFLLVAMPVKAIGALDGPVTALPLGAGAPGADGVEMAAWIWPSVICLTGGAGTPDCPLGASVNGGAVTVTVTVNVGQTDDAGTKIAGTGVVAGPLLGAGMIVATSLGAGSVIGTSLGAGLTSGII